MIDFYTSLSPNGWKVAIFLEETALPYRMFELDMSKEQQKSADFLRINPNGKIPAIVDRDAGDMTVWESGAILYYLADKTGKFLPKEMKPRMQTMQWLMFQMSGVGPMMGQANVFNRLFPHRIEQVITRYQNEVRRLHRVMDNHLSSHAFFADEYTIADMAIWPWVYLSNYIGVDLAPFCHLSRWLDEVGARPAVQRGIRIPRDLTAIFEGDEETIRKFLEEARKNVSGVEFGETAKNY